MDALIIKKEHLDKILAGKKTWELRGSKTHKRGKIALIESGSLTVVGVCELVDCTDELSDQELYASVRKHQVSKDRLDGGIKYKKTYAWVLKGAKRLKKPIPYSHPRGAIIWVKVADV